jgi:hypothetical protein
MISSRSFTVCVPTVRVASSSSSTSKSPERHALRLRHEPRTLATFGQKDPMAVGLGVLEYGVSTRRPTPRRSGRAATDTLTRRTDREAAIQ